MISHFSFLSLQRFTLAIAGVVALASTAACDLGGALGVTFDVEVDSSVTVDGNPLGGLTGGLGFSGFNSLDFESTREFENNNTEKELVQSATLKSVTMTVTSPSDGDFDWLDEIEFYIEAPDEERVLVASKTIPDGESEVTLDIEAVELAPYIKSDTVSFSTEATGSQPDEDHTIEAVIVVEVTAGPNS